MIDARLRSGPFADSVDIFTAPRMVGVGDAIASADMIADLRRSGYNNSRDNPVGWFNVPAGPARRIEIFPGRGSFAGGEPAMLEFKMAVLRGLSRWRITPSGSGSPWALN